MNIIKKWRNQIPNDPSHDVRKIIYNRSKEEQKAILNGSFLQFHDLNSLQLALLWNQPIKYDSFFYRLIELGASIDKLSSKGLNFMHIYLFLLYYSPSFRDERIYHLFFKFLNYGFNPTQCLCTSNNVFTYLDMLILLQKGNILKLTSFIGKHFINKDLCYQKLDQIKFEKLFLTFLCYGVPFQHEHCLQNMTWFNCEKYLTQHKVFEYYVKERLKVPITITVQETTKRLKYILLHHRHIRDLANRFDSKGHPIGMKDKNAMNNFFNIEFVGNQTLQHYEFLPPVTEKEQSIYFHKSFFFHLISKRVNPFTRTELDQTIIEKWKEYVNNNSIFIFPIQDILSINENIYLFSDQKINDSTFKLRQSFHFIQQFFEIYHPYHQINRLYNLKKFEVKYISHLFYYETNILKNFSKVMHNPSVTQLYKVMLYYCRKSIKYVSIMYFLMEEIFQDLSCYEKLKPYITSLNDNYDLLFEQYILRFEHFDTQYMNKFVENMLVIYRYEEELKEK